MILHQLRKKYKNIRTGGSFEKDSCQFEFPLRLPDQGISTDALYIATSMEVENYYAALKDCHIICLKKPRIPQKYRFSILMIEDDVDLGQIINDVIFIFQLYHNAYSPNFSAIPYSFELIAVS